VSQIFAAIRFVDAYGTKKSLSEECLYEGRKIESPLRFWAGK
jgi:hypothetical protein